jgi:ParB-like chromosome segregation protein Spo0J
MKLKDIKPNPNNPRVLRDDKFQKLKQSITEFPKMLSLRPMVIDENNVVLGGNMRLRALQELGFTDVEEAWVKRSSDLTEDEKKRFIIADNVAFGEWDWDALANDWEVVDLEAWGLNIPQFNNDVNLDDFFEDSNEQKEEKFKITLEYAEDDFNIVNEALKKHSGSKEQIIFKLLGL